MKVPAELTDSWLEEAKVNCDTLREVAEYIAQRAAELALSNVSMEPVAWQYRSQETHPMTVNYGEWSEWEDVKPRNFYMQTVQERVAEFEQYIKDGYAYELRKLYTATQLAQARQQGAEEERKKRLDWAVAWKELDVNVLHSRIAELEQKNAQLLEALKELAAEEWRDDDDQILDRARIKARAAIAEVKP